MIETYKDAGGLHIRQADPRYPDRWLYIYKIHRDGSAEWTTDYSLALRISAKRAERLMKTYVCKVNGGKSND